MTGKHNISQHLTERSLRIYTIGHSNRSLEELVDLLQSFGIETLADIRSLPGSKRFPGFNRENLETLLPQNGIRYIWFRKLGGLRHSRKDFQSPNIGLTNSSFRSYADYMETDNFVDAVHELIQLASESIAACMCAEAVYWRCHRRLLSDYLVGHGVDVIHILSRKQAIPHEMTPGSLVTSQGQVIYP
jgi:uncharacterized protein (DUF488 family)